MVFSRGVSVEGVGAQDLQDVGEGALGEDEGGQEELEASAEGEGGG